MDGNGIDALHELGIDRFRASVGICPRCLALYDGASYDPEEPRCADDHTELLLVRVKVAYD